MRNYLRSVSRRYRHWWGKQRILPIAFGIVLGAMLLAAVVGY